MSFFRSLIDSPVISHRYTSAVILAAGEGSRFGNEDGTKQNALVAGIPAAARAALPFQACSEIDEIILVGKADELSLLESYVKDYELTKVTRVVEGGARRDESSMKGAEAVSDKCRYIAIHDAARCLVTEKIIKDTLRAAIKYGSAAAAERVVDTVKIADNAEFVKETPDRETVWLVKTPQIFKFHIYETAAAIARRDGISVTDDCMMAEHCGFKIKLVDCGHENIKLTAREDLALAEFILSKREDGKR